MRSIRLLFPLLFLFGLSACAGEESSPTDSTDPGTIPAKPANGTQIVTSEFTLPPGREIQSCFHTTLANESEVFVRRFDAFQGQGGHHVILMTPVTPMPEGTIEDCTSGDTMVNYVPLVLSIELNHLELDGGLAIRLPPHVPVVVQSHYVNTSSEAVSVRDIVNLEFLEPGVKPIPVGFWGTSYLELAVPPQRKSTLKYRCVAEQEMQLLSLIGHMHDHGSSLSIDIGPPDATKRIYALDTWEASFRDTPPQTHWPLDAPFVVHAGEVIDVTCNYSSTASETLKFPVEMCASNAWFYPAQSSVVCFATLLGGDAAGG